MSDSENDNKEYKGPGKFTAAVGKGVTEGFVASLGVGAAGAVIGAIVKKKPSGPLTELLAEKSMRVSDAYQGALSGGTIGSAIGQLAGFVHGAYQGIQNVDAAQKQVAQLATSAEKATLEVEHQKDHISTLMRERESKHHDAKDHGRS